MVKQFEHGFNMVRGQENNNKSLITFYRFITVCK